MMSPEEYLAKNSIDLGESTAGAEDDYFVDEDEKKTLDQKNLPELVLGGGRFVQITDYAWDAGDSNTSTVTIYIDLPGVGNVKDSTSIEFGPKLLDLKIAGLNGKNYRFLRENLSHEIVPKESKMVVKSDKVVLKLKKKKNQHDHYNHWLNLSMNVATKKKDIYDDPEEDETKTNQSLKAYEEMLVKQLQDQGGIDALTGKSNKTPEVTAEPRAAKTGNYEWVPSQYQPLKK